LIVAAARQARAHDGEGVGFSVGHQRDGTDLRGMRSLSFNLISSTGLEKSLLAASSLCSIYNTRILSMGKSLYRTKMRQLTMDLACRVFLRCR
jgi:hypothetical protein